jgi:hypothetical protein
VNVLLRFIRRYSLSVQLILSSFAAIFVGIYINLLTGNMNNGIWAAIRNLSWSNLWAVGGSIVIALQVLLINMYQDKDEDDKTKVIRSMLEAAARAIIYPETADSVFIRGFCHIVDENEQGRRILRPICMWSAHWVPDFDACIPLEGPDSDVFTIVQAFKNRTIVANHITDETRAKYPEPIRAQILPDLQCVIAAPIRDFNDSNSRVLGTIAFDSTSCFEDMGFNTADARDIVMLFARSVFLLMKQ